MYCLSFVIFARGTRRDVLRAFCPDSNASPSGDHVISQRDCLRNLLACMVLTNIKPDCRFCRGGAAAKRALYILPFFTGWGMSWEAECGICGSTLSFGGSCGRQIW